MKIKSLLFNDTDKCLSVNAGIAKFNRIAQNTASNPYAEHLSAN